MRTHVEDRRQSVCAAPNIQSYNLIDENRQIQNTNMSDHTTQIADMSTDILLVSDARTEVRSIPSQTTNDKDIICDATYRR
jgi:hypothetical protein